VNIEETGEQGPWQASDGTQWLWFQQYDEWLGWMPGEDGLWTRSREEFRNEYPDAPPLEETVKAAAAPQDDITTEGQEDGRGGGTDSATQPAD
jgi:hypothetical protein